MVVIVFLFAGMLGIACFLSWCGFQRIATHLQDKPDATRAVVEHVLMPLLGKTGGTGRSSSLDVPSASAR